MDRANTMWHLKPDIINSTGYNCPSRRSTFTLFYKFDLQQPTCQLHTHTSLPEERHLVVKNKQPTTKQNSLSLLI